MTSPTPADYTTCIACGCDFAPPNGTDLCGLCRKPDAPRVYRVERDGRWGDLREFVAGHLDVTDAVADDLRRVATENGLPLNQIPCDLPGVVTFATAQVLPVLTADGWRIAPASVDPTAAPDG